MSTDDPSRPAISPAAQACRRHADELREHLLSVAESAPIAVWDWDLESGIIWRGPGLAASFGWSPDELEPTPEAWRKLVHPEDRDRVVEKVQAAVRAGEPVWTDEYRLELPDGSYTHVLDRAQLITDETGEPIRVVGMLADLSKQQRLGSEAARRTRQQSLLADLAGQTVAADDLDTVLELATVTLTEALDVEYANVLEHRPTHEDLLLRAGTGWHAGLVGEATVPDDQGSQAGYTLLQHGPVIVPDLDEETRFQAPSLLTDHDVRSGMSIPIRTSRGTWGVLGAHSTGTRRFTDPDVDLFTSVASIVAAAIDRHRAQERFELATRATEEVIWEYDILEDRFWYSPMLEEVFGWDPDAFRGIDGWAQKVHPDDREDALGAIDAWLEDPDDALGITYRMERADGTVAYVKDHGYLVEDEEGRPLRVVGAMRDITDEVEAEETLALQARMLDEIGQAVIATDAQGQVTYWNQAAEELFGWSREEAIGRNVLELTVPDEASVDAAEIMASLQAGEAWTGQFEVKRKDGSTFPAIVSDSPILDDDGELAGVIGVTTDITEQKEAEQALEASRARLDHLLSEAPTVIFTAEPEAPWDVTWMCPNIEHVLGEPTAAFTENRSLWWEKIPDEDRERIEEHLETLDPGDKVSIEHRFHQDGGRRWLRSDLRHVQHENGEGAEIVGASIDVTARVAAEEQLVESERRKAAILEALPDMVFRVARDGSFLEFFPGEGPSQPALDPSEFLGRRVQDVFPGELGDRFQATHEAAIETGEIQGIEYTLDEGEDASVFEARVVKAGPEEVVTVVRDVTEERRHQEALAESEQRFRELAENIDSVFWVTTPDMGPAEYVSPAFEEIWGFPVAEMEENPEAFFDAVHPKDRSAVETHLEGPLTEEREVQYRVVQPDGEVRWVHDRAFPVRDDVGEIVRVVGIAEDITERVEAQQALAESEQRFREVAENIDAVFWLTPPDKAEMLYVSPAFEEIWGRPVDTVYENALSFLDAVHPEDRDRVRDRLPEQAEGTYDIQYRVVQPDGEVRWVHDRAFPVRDEDGEVERIAGIAEDITEQRALEQELRESQERLEATISGAPMVLFAIEPDGTFLLSEGRGLEQLGLEPGEVLGDNVFELYADHPQATEAIQQALAGEIQSSLFEVNGLWWQTQYQLETDASGEPARMICVALDVTDRVQAQQALVEHKRRLDFALEGLPLVLLTLSPEGRYTLLQGHGLDHLDMDPEAAIGQPIDAFFGDNPQVMEPVERALAGEETASRMKVEGRVFHTQFVPVHDDRGELEAVHGLAIDITEQAETEAELQRQREMLGLLAENLEDSLWAVSVEDMSLEYLSPSHEALWGVPVDVAMEDPEAAMATVHPEDEAMLREAFETGAIVEMPDGIEYRVEHPDKGTRYLRTTASFVRGPDGTPEQIVGVTRDITSEKDAQRVREERIRAEAEIERLREVDRFKTEFLNTTAHELSNPMTPIRFQVEALSSGMLGELNEAQEESVELLERNFQRLRRLVEDLLDAARLQQDRLSVEREPQPLADIVDEVLATLGPRADDAEVELEAGTVEPIDAPVDRDRIAQVLINLVGNAIKFTPAGGDVTVSLEGHGDGAAFTVEDTGIGMTQDQIDRLFNPFTRVHDASQTEEGGTGLGLYITQGLVEAHDGTITVDSAGPGRGSTFAVWLPLDPPDDEA